MNSKGFRETFLRNGRKTQGAIRPEERRQAEGKSVSPDREDQREDLEFRGNKEHLRGGRAENGPENTAAVAARTSRSKSC